MVWEDGGGNAPSYPIDLAQSAVNSQFDADDVILLGADQRLVHDLPANPGVDWTSYTVPLEASAWRINSRTGDPASEAQLQTVLGALTALHIRGEYRDGGDTGKLDNVRLEGGSGADLEVTISASPDPVFAGDLLTYTITVTNHGPDDATGVLVTASGPAEPAGAEPAGISFSGGGRLHNLAGGVIDVNPAEPAGIRIANLSNDGTVTVRSGALELTAGASTGRFDVAARADLNFAGSFAWDNGTNFAGAGSIRIDPAGPAGNRVTVNGNVSLANLDIGRFGVLQVGGTLTTTGTINVRGTLSGTGTIHGRVRNAGVVRPGSSPGILTVIGNYVQTPQGLLVLEIGGRVPGVKYDQLKVTGLATLAGRVEIVAINGFTPHPTDRFRALNLARQIGSLTPTNLAFELAPDGSLRPVPLTVGTITGNGSLRARRRNFRFHVSATLRDEAVSFRGQLRYQDKPRRLALISTGFTRVQIDAPRRRVLIQGTALLNGLGGYRFTVWMEDRALGFPGGRDRFRILIEGPDGFRYDSKDYAPTTGALDRGNLTSERSWAIAAVRCRGVTMFCCNRVLSRTWSGSVFQ